MGRAVMAASPEGGAGTARGADARPRVRGVPVLREISRFWWVIDRTLVTCGYGCSAVGLSRVRRADLPAFRVVWGVRFGPRTGRVRGGAEVPGVIVAQPSALAISARDRASSSAASARSRRALANQGA